MNRRRLLIVPVVQNSFRYYQVIQVNTTSSGIISCRVVRCSPIYRCTLGGQKFGDTTIGSLILSITAASRGAHTVASTYYRTYYYRGIWSHTLPSAYSSCSGQTGTSSDSRIWYGLTRPPAWPQS